VSRDGANVAQILRHNKIRLEPLEQFRVERVNILVTADKFPHLSLDLRRKRGRIHPRPNQRRLFRRFRREIAFVSNSNDGIARADSVENFRRRGKQ
jgi:hypothetical protein